MVEYRFVRIFIYLYILCDFYSCVFERLNCVLCVSVCLPVLLGCFLHMVFEFVCVWMWLHLSVFTGMCVLAYFLRVHA